MASSLFAGHAVPTALVTRPRQEADGLAAELATRGIAALIEPLLQIHPRVPEAFDLDGVQAVLCTSGNGVDGLVQATGDRGVRILAVGDATAARARAAGFTAVESAGGNVDDLVRLAAARLDPRYGLLIHVAGDLVAGDLAAGLGRIGFAVERRVLYEARPISALSPATLDSLRRGGIRFALFFSPRSSAIFARLAAAARVAECCATITALSISPAADAALVGLPWLDRRVADRPGQAALLDMLDRVVGERRQAGTGI